MPQKHGQVIFKVLNKTPTPSDVIISTMSLKCKRLAIIVINPIINTQIDTNNCIRYISYIYSIQ